MIKINSIYTIVKMKVQRGCIRRAITTGRCEQMRNV